MIDLTSINEATSSFEEVIDDGLRELVYILFEEDIVEQLGAKPMLISNGILATTDIDAAAWLAELQSRPVAMYAIPSERLDKGAFVSACEATNVPDASIAGCGFFSYHGIVDPIHLIRVSPDRDDVREAISDLVEMEFGKASQAFNWCQKNAILVWASECSNGTAIVLSRGEEIRPWSVIAVGDRTIGEECEIAANSWEDAGEWRNLQTAESTGLLLEYARKNMGASLRLKRVVTDALLSRTDLPGKIRTVTVTGDKLTVKVGRKVYYFKVQRDDTGWITGVEFLRPKGREAEVEFVKTAIVDAFKGASLQHAIEDACSGAKPNLVMLDYVRLDGGRRTRLVEPYSYRRKGKLNRRYFFGWNVEEGGIRSYIADSIKGARRTSIPFTPRFLVEIGAGQRLRKGHAYPIKRGFPETVSDAVIKRAHVDFELAGGRGKIIKRLGHSVDARKTPKGQARARVRAKKKQVPE